MILPLYLVAGTYLWCSSRLNSRSSHIIIYIHASSLLAETLQEKKNQPVVDLFHLTFNWQKLQSNVISWDENTIFKDISHVM